MFHRTLLLSCVACLSLTSLSPSASGAEAELFPFVVGYDAADTVANASRWLERPAGKHGFVRAKAGHLVHDKGPIRFWATNLCFDACFPTHEAAQRVAARLASLGVNCVRLHHMDSRSIWGQSPDKLTIDPQQLEKLDYLIHRLKEHGVYVDINLHVSRWFDVKEGFVERERRPHYDKGLDNFEPRMIELQKKYARDLLTHVNPYTKTAYIAEPAVAFVEINNENALYSTWNSGQLDDLPDPYATTFRKLWNAWLLKKYGAAAALAKAWNVGARPLGAEMLAGKELPQRQSQNPNNGSKRPERVAVSEGDGTGIKKPWQLEADRDGQCRLSVRDAGPDAPRCLHLEVTRLGSTPWRPQVVHTGLKLEQGMTYTLSFRIRANAERKLHVNCMMAHEPWKQLGLAATPKAGPAWTSHRYTFVAEQSDANARISFSTLPVGEYDLADVSFRPGGIVGLEEGQRPENDSVPILRRHGASPTAIARADWADFMWETERDYWLGMHRFLKDDLHVRSLVSGTQWGYGPLHIQAKLDYIDNHSYWNHPHFPHKPWDSKDWYVTNSALVNAPGGTLTRLAAARVAGMAYTISEYNHPQPNSYTAEGFPLIAAFAAFQDWDGIFSFAYGHNDRHEPQKIESFFDIKSDPGKLVHMPACAAMFLRGDVTPATKFLAAPLSAEDERCTLRDTLNSRSLHAVTMGMPWQTALLHGVGLNLAPAASAAPQWPAIAEDATRFVSDTGQLTWDVSKPDAGCFTVDAPRTKLFTGFVAGRRFTLGKVGLQIASTRLDWATVSLVAIDGHGFDQPGRVLIAASAWLQNRNAQLQQLPNNRVTLSNHWGSEPILCEGVPAEITLPVAADRVRLYPLDPSGRRRAPIPVDQRQGSAVLKLGPQHATLWYEAEIR